MGNGTPECYTKDVYKRQVQGRNDPRVPVTEAEQAVAALRKMGRTVEYICYDDEGHGVAYLKNKIDCYSKVAAFLKKYL